MKKQIEENFPLGTEIEESQIFVKGFVIGMPSNCFLLQYYVRKNIYNEKI